MAVGFAQIQTWKFIIGGVPLAKFEVPAEFTIGFEKQLATHKFLAPDGNSAIATHTLGVYPVPMTWKGTLFGGTALERYQKIERLATQLVPTTFVFGPLSYSVDIEFVKGTIHHRLEIDYEISMVTIQANTKNQQAPAFKPNSNIDAESIYATGSEAFLQTVQPSVVNPPPYEVTQAYQDCNAKTMAAVPFSNAGYAALQALELSLIKFNNLMVKYVNTLRALHIDEAGTRNLLNATTALTNFALFTTTVQTLQNGGPSAKTVVAEAGTNLFVISRQFYPNADTATGAQLIARSNGLSDYFISSQTKLTIPPLTTSTSN